MDKKLEQTPHKERYVSDQWAHVEMQIKLPPVEYLKLRLTT